MKFYRCDICGRELLAAPGEYHRTPIFGGDVCPRCYDEWNRIRVEEVWQLIIDEIRDRITEGSNR